MSNLDVTVPSLGESITEAVIAKWLKKEGEIVNKDEIKIEISSSNLSLSFTLAEVKTLM